MTEKMSADLPIAGRELDALIAEKVMGLTGRRVVYRWQDRKSREYPLIAFDYAKDWNVAENSFATHVNENGEKENAISFASHYSADISAAWLVVEKLIAEGKQVEVSGYRDEGDPSVDPWVVLVDLEVSHAKSAPLAICLAALKSVSARSPLEAEKKEGK